EAAAPADALALIIALSASDAGDVLAAALAAASIPASGAEHVEPRDALAGLAFVLAARADPLALAAMASCGLAVAGAASDDVESVEAASYGLRVAKTGVEALQAAEALALALTLAARAGEASVTLDGLTLALLRQRIVRLLGRLTGPRILPGRLTGPIILRGRLGAMTITHPEFEVEVGDGYRLQIAIDLGPNQPADLAGATAEFGYGLTPAPADRLNAERASAAVGFGTVGLRGLTYPSAEISLSAEETRLLPPCTLFHWACRVSLPGAEPDTVARGTFRTADVPI
ncbi:hypothetical protein, partial [Methylobacterium gnaphalii]